jgi:hypothetical protein
MDARIKSGHDGCVLWSEVKEHFVHTPGSNFSESQNNSKRALATSQRKAPESLINLSPHKKGVGNAGCPLHPRPRVRFVVVRSTRVTTSTPESPGIPARNGFNGLCRALPGDRALLPPSSRGLRFCHCPVGPIKPPQDLTPAPGRQDHTILPSATASLVSVLLIAHRIIRTRPAIPSRAKRCRVHRIPPRVRDDRDTPLFWGGTRKVLDVIWGVRKQKYFCKGDSTRLSTNRPTGKSLEPVLLSIRRMG